MVVREEKSHQSEIPFKQCFRSDESKHGLGNFASEDIKKGQVIAVLNGERIDRDELIRRQNLGLEGVDDDLQIAENKYLDLDEPSRLFNHSCDPNAGIRGESELFALRDIQKDEEIFFDYSTTVHGNSTWTMQCNCGSENCRKIIGGISTIPGKRLKWYAQSGALPDFTIKELRNLRLEI